MKKVCKDYLLTSSLDNERQETPPLILVKSGLHILVEEIETAIKVMEVRKAGPNDIKVELNMKGIETFTKMYNNMGIVPSESLKSKLVKKIQRIQNHQATAYKYF